MAFQTWQTFEFTMRKPSVLLHLWQANVMQAHSSRFKLLVLGMWVLLPLWGTFNPTMPARQRQRLMILMTWLDSQCSAEAKSKLDSINVGCSFRRIQQVLGSWNMMSTASQWGRVGWLVRKSVVSRMWKESTWLFGKKLFQMLHLRIWTISWERWCFTHLLIRMWGAYFLFFVMNQQKAFRLWYFPLVSTLFSSGFYCEKFKQ